MAEKGLITSTTDKNGKKVYSVIRRFGDRTCRFVEFFIGKRSEAKNPIDDIDDDEPPASTDASAYMDGFAPVSLDGDLPF